MLGRVVSTALTMAAADTVAQRADGWIDWKRTARYATAGTVSLVPLFSMWYTFIDRKFDSRNWVVKLVVECVTIGPLYLALLIGNEELLKTRDLSLAALAVRNKWSNLYLESLKIVPFYQAINFALVPHNLRIYWLNGCQLLWNVYASTLVHQK